VIRGLLGGVLLRQFAAGGFRTPFVGRSFLFAVHPADVVEDDCGGVVVAGLDCFAEFV